jgi:hypothetical protein
MVSRLQNVGQNHSLLTTNKHFENMANLNYFGTTGTNQNYIQEETESRFNSRNACYHCVRSLLSSCVLSKNLNLEYIQTQIYPLFCMGVEFDIHTKGRT